MQQNNFIKKIQGQPEHVKKVIMWIGILFIMTAIFTFWLLTFPSSIPKTEDNQIAANLKNELPSVWQTFKSQINNIQNLWPK